ncbi:MAG: DCC1-like thiol-disulfide oxidoreductase family protein [Cellvibrionaceae bacterium]
MTLDDLLASKKNYLLYDGECPVCSNYVAFVKFKERVGEIEVMDCRQFPEIVTIARASGYELNDGMILIVEGRLYYGKEAVHQMALLSGETGIFNRFQSLLFRYKFVSTLLYPLMVMGRKCLLFLIGRPRI